MANLIRLPVVETKTGLKHSAIYRRIAKGEFPKPIPLGGGPVAWDEAEINQWIESRRSERGQHEAPIDRWRRTDPNWRKKWRASLNKAKKQKSATA